LGFISPHGPVATEDRYLSLLVISLMALVVVPVLVLTPLVAWRYRLTSKTAAYRPNWDFSWTLEVLIWGLPTGIVIVLGVFLWRETHRLDPYRPIEAALPALQVQAVGLDWKWLFIYPDLHIASLNELAFPSDRSVHVSLTSATVMQSLMVSQLAGQIYAMAGMTTQLNLKADAPGRFIGENTQFNGTGFQNQKFAALALSPDDFSRWVARVRAANNPLGAAAYAQVAKPSSVAAPVYFSTVEDGLFAYIVASFHHTGTTAAAANGHAP
jgi:cytochrome o ubiquinol oxidase subunit 2